MGTSISVICKVEWSPGHQTNNKICKKFHLFTLFLTLNFRSSGCSRIKILCCLYSQKQQQRICKKDIMSEKPDKFSKIQLKKLLVFLVLRLGKGCSRREQHSVPDNSNQLISTQPFMGSIAEHELAKNFIVNTDHIHLPFMPSFLLF